MSHPVWVRGLKQSLYIVKTILRVSHPVWVRGLKLYYRHRQYHVAERRTPCGCVD